MKLLFSALPVALLVFSGGASANTCTSELWGATFDSVSNQGTDETASALRLMCGIGLRPDEAAGLAQLKSEAERGVANAQFALGVTYLQGQIVPKDGVTASGWFRAAAYQMQSNAAAGLIAIEKNGHNISSTQWNLFQTVGREAARGVTESQLQLALWFDRSDGDTKRKDVAIHWYRAAAMHGSVIAQRGLGILLMSSDVSEGRRWMESAAAAGDMIAQLELGLNYLFGRRWEPDSDQAYKWLRLAAAQGSNNVRIRLGDMFRQGNGVPIKLPLSYALYFPVTGQHKDLDAQLEKYHPLFEDEMSPEEINLGKSLVRTMAKPEGFLQALDRVHAQ